MAIWPFGKKQSEEYEVPQEEITEEQPTSNLPEEVQEYYESGQKERVGVAWLLGIGTLVVTLILAAGLFFGGRWVYRKVANKDKDTTTTQISQNANNKNQNQSKQNSSGSSNNSGSNQSQGSTATPAPATPSTPTPAPQSQPATPAPAPTSPSSPATGTTTPNTGPGDVFAIAAIAAVASMIGYYAVQLRKQS